MTLAELRDRIRRAFPADPFRGEVTPCPCEECSEIRDHLAGRAWNAVPNRFLDLSRSPTLLEAEAFCAFLPAYLCRSLDVLAERDPITLEFTLYSILPDKSNRERLAERVRLMSAAQIDAVREFLAYLAEHPEPHWIFSRDIARALDRWQSFPTPPAAASRRRKGQARR